MKEPIDTGTPLTYSKRTAMFVEMPAFTDALSEHLNDDQYRAFQEFLAANPEVGDLVVSGRGLRKLRWKIEGGGKRGGVRVLYYWVVQDRIVVLAFIFSKRKTDDLTQRQYKALADYVRSEYP